MNVIIKEKEYFVDPILVLSSLEPDTTNDWTAWENDDQSVLAYDDIIFLALNDEKYYGKEYTIYFTSSQIKLDSTIDNDIFIKKRDSSQKTWGGYLSLKAGTLIVGETSSGGYKIFVGTNTLKIEIFTNFFEDSPYILINFELLPEAAPVNEQDKILL